MSKVYRVYVEKRKDFAVESVEMFNQLKTELKIEGLQSVSIAHRYDIQGVSKEAFDQGVNIILSEPMVDDVLLEDYPIENKKVFADNFSVNPMGRLRVFDIFSSRSCSEMFFCDVT